AQYLRKMQETVDVDGCLRWGDFGPINQWNREHIWQYGSTYTPAEIFQKATGEAFDPTVYTAYLEEKYTDLYDL
ncbi:MAG: carboxypeptidase M32, partial [Clostridiales bacterium]|nr:carboxypeptidase M32 [Clostridiales bacterium]